MTALNLPSHLKQIPFSFLLCVSLVVNRQYGAETGANFPVVVHVGIIDVDDVVELR